MEGRALSYSANKLKLVEKRKTEEKIRDGEGRKWVEYKGG